ncbi:hypothetical protein HYW94_01750 [Candidatus Uhrbacteria bacterium]|nr:hypothetical protein [Candidatus Uhrbacteria bacterium]
MGAVMLFSAPRAYAGIPQNELPSDIQKKLGVGKEVAISGWAWNDNMGWMSQRGSIVAGGQTTGTYGIAKNAAGEVAGWSWSPNYGWICWGKTCTGAVTRDLRDTETYGNDKPTVETDGVSLQVEPDVSIEAVTTTPSGAYAFLVSGWIKAIGLKDDGWMSLRGVVQCPQNMTDCPDKDKEYGVAYDPDHKEFRGWAWSPKLGWTVFSGQTLYSTPYRYAKVTDAEGDEKWYDVVEQQFGEFLIIIKKKNRLEWNYIIKKDPSDSAKYIIDRVNEFKRDAEGAPDSSTLRQVPQSEWDTVDVYDESACQKGCTISYNVETEKSTWKTQLLSPWIQTAGGSVFSRKGFGGASAATGKNVQYLLYSGGITLEDDLREGEKLELSCCTDDTVSVTKIGKPQIIANQSYGDLSGGGEIRIVKQGGKIKKKSGSGASDAASDLNTAFSGLLEGEERRLKKKDNDVEVRMVYSLYASLKKDDTGMDANASVTVKKTNGSLKKDDDSELSSQLKTALSSEKRIVGSITNWTSACDESESACKQVGRKSGTDLKKTDALKREQRPDVAFSQKIGNIRRNTLGSLDIDKLIENPNVAQSRNVHGYKVVSIENEQGILDVMTEGLDDRIFVRNNGDLSIGSNSTRNLFEFKNGIPGKAGQGTIIVDGGNLYIYRSIQYESGSVSDIRSLASVAWIVLEKNGKGGNIIFDPCIPAVSMTIKTPTARISQEVAPVVGIFFAEGTITTGDGDAGACRFSNDIPLYIDGMLIARKFMFQRIYSGDPDLNIASEFIQDTGRATANTPPGLGDILKSLPLW